MKEENFLHAFYNRIYDYFTAKGVRKVFFFSLCVVLVLLFMSVGGASGALSSALVIAAIVCAGASAVDTWDSRKKFLSDIYAIEYAHFVRLVETMGEKAALESKGLLNDDEVRWVKRKKREYSYSFAAKVTIIVFLVVLLLGVM